NAPSSSSAPHSVTSHSRATSPASSSLSMDGGVNSPPWSAVGPDATLRESLPRVGADPSSFRRGPPSTSTDTCDTDADALQQRRRHRQYHGVKATAKGNHIRVSSELRRGWLFNGCCMGDRQRPITEQLSLLPPFYTAALDAEAAEGICMSAVSDEWD